MVEEKAVPLPVQVWMPFMERSPMDAAFERDLQRAYGTWRDEVRIWLQPEAKKVSRWYRAFSGLRMTECMFPSETLNSITIYHVDEERRLFPSLGTQQSPQRQLPEGLYRRWLNAEVYWIADPREFTWSIPYIEGERVVYRDTRILTAPGPLLPFTGVDADNHRVRAVWPPPGRSMPTPVSPETESATYYGHLTRVRHSSQQDELYDVVSARDSSMRAARLWPKWPEPFHAMFPTGGGIDLLYHQALMRKCVEDIAERRDNRAMQVIEGWMNHLSGEGDGPLDRAWFLPRLFADPDVALYDVEGKFGIAAATVQELVSLPEFHNKMQDRARVRRVQGWLGYFWWELYQDMIGRVPVRFCQACGQMIRGGQRNRQYCTHDENAECFRKRNATAQRRGRSKRRPNRSRI
jgi:hypothetical protein